MTDIQRFKNSTERATGNKVVNNTSEKQRRTRIYFFGLACVLLMSIYLVMKNVFVLQNTVMHRIKHEEIPEVNPVSKTLASSALQRVHHHETNESSCLFVPTGTAVTLNNCGKSLAGRTSSNVVVLKVWPFSDMEKRNAINIQKFIDLKDINSTETVEEHPFIDLVGYDTREEDGFSAGLILGNRISYASRFNYSYHYFSRQLIQSEDKMMIKLSKFEALRRVLNPALDGKQWVMWTDTDVLITNETLSLESHIIARYAHDRTSMIVTRDLHLTPINSGILLLKNSRWTHDLLTRILDHGKELLLKARARRKDFALVDQPIITSILDEAGVGTMNPESIGNQVEITEHVSIVPTRTMNSFCRPYQGMKQWDSSHVQTGMWHPGDFIAHITGTTNARTRYRTIYRLLSFFSGEQIKTTKGVSTNEHGS